MKQRIRAKAVRALVRHTRTAITELQHDEDEMLRGARSPMYSNFGGFC